MSGEQIRAMRERLGVDSAWLARLFNVAPSTVYRWEAQGTERIRAEGLTRDLLYVLAYTVEATPDPAALRDTLTDATARGGSVGGIAALLNRA